MSGAATQESTAVLFCWSLFIEGSPELHIYLFFTNEAAMLVPTLEPVSYIFTK